MLAFAAPKDAKPPNFVEKTFADSHKTATFTKVFSLERFLLFGILSAGHFVQHETVNLNFVWYIIYEVLCGLLLYMKGVYDSSYSAVQPMKYLESDVMW